MGDELKSIAAFVETGSTQFDADSLYEAIQNIAEGTVWNYIAGAYFFKTLLSPQAVTKLLKDSAFPAHIVIEMDPVLASGLLPREAWNSWFADLFLEDLDRIAKAKGWDADVVAALRAEKAKKT